VSPKPCVFIAFDRPDIGRITLAPLLELPKLYLFCDGPTPEHPSQQQEYKKIFEETRKHRKNLKTEIWTPPQNYGPLLGPPTAYLWMLEKEKSGTIVEEDVLTTPAFHNLSSWALENFEQDDTTIALSSGLPNCQNLIPTPYAKSNLLLVWGWGTWYEKIKDIPIPHPAKPPQKNLSLLEQLHYQRLTRTLRDNPHYAWSPYLQLHLLHSQKKTLFPRYKTTQNLGVNPQARRSRGTPDTPPEIEPTKSAPDRALATLSQKSNLTLFKKKHGGLLKEIRVRLAIKTRLKKLLR